MTPRPFGTVGALVDALGKGAREHDGEEVDALTHGLQCAALLAERAAGDGELQVAGLVHDVASILRPGRPRTHAAEGAALVAPLLGERVARLVGQHDQAKRYLVTTEPEYRARLSEYSVLTLAEQGGAMSGSELAAFRAGHDFEAAVALRRADDDAKVPGRIVPGLDAWRAPLEDVASQRR